MGSRRKPRCFVAMAFDHNDTDALYEDAILPVLKANGIVPIIINRRQDNRDINHQIIEQLDASDFCITDLTYTRPSVYFEAGYAQRAVEVIYTVRSDHLHKNQPDNLRVHFDLQMKPLIKWKTPSDAMFPGRLERRIRSTVLRAWNTAQKKRKKEQEERASFAHMPLTKRLFALRKEAVSTISKLGFAAWTPLYGAYSQSHSVLERFLPQLGESHWIMSERREKRRLHVVSLRIEESLTLKPLRDEFRSKFLSSYPPHLKSDIMAKERSPVNQTIEHHLLGSLRTVPRSRIMSALPSLRWDAANERYTFETEWEYRGHKWKTGGKRDLNKDWVAFELSASRVIYVHLIDDIQSLPEFRSRLGQMMDQMVSNQQRPSRRH